MTVHTERLGIRSHCKVEAVVGCGSHCHIPWKEADSFASEGNACPTIVVDSLDSERQEVVVALVHYGGWKPSCWDGHKQRKDWVDHRHD